jgi:hypothetical protein
MHLYQWLKTRKDEITAGVAILAVLVNILGFWFTISQLSRATSTLQATNTYQVQKDARDVLEKILAEPEFGDAIRGKISADNESMVAQNLWIMFNFYLSVFRQAEANGLSPEFISSFKKDFCRFLEYPTVSAEWEKLSSEQRLGPSHEKMRREWCGA